VKIPAPAGVFLASLALYLATLYPAFPVDDSPETVSASVNLGVQHAPGYPLDTLAGKLFQAIPIGGPYIRVNLLAAVAGAGSAAAVAALAAHLFPTPAGAAAGALAGLMLAGSSVFWDCSISAKGGIYQLNLLLILLALASFLSGRPVAGTLFTGLGMANHWMSIVVWVPVFLALARPWNARKLLMGALAGALGFSLYLQLPLGARHEPVWGDPAHAGGLVDIFMRRGFGQHATYGKAAFMPFIQAGDGLLRPFHESGLPFAFLALAGLVALWRSRRRAALALLAGAVLNIAAVAVATNPVHIATGELYLWLTDRFYLPFLAVCAVGAGAGLLLIRSALPARWRPAWWALGATLVLVIAGTRYHTENHSADYLGFDFAQNLLVNIPGPAVILGEADYQTFPLHALLRVEDRRPDIQLVITNPFLNRIWGWKRLAGRFPEAAAANSRGAKWEDKVVLFTDLMGQHADIYHQTMCSYPLLRPRLAFHGLLYSVEKTAPAEPRTPTPEEVEGYFRRYRMRGMYTDSPYKDPTAFSVLDVYPLSLATAGAAPLRRKDAAGVIKAYLRALKLPGAMGRAAIEGVLGKLYAEQGRYAEAETAFREAVRIKPGDLALWTNLATACAAQGKYLEAARLFESIIRRDPGNAAAVSNLRLLQGRMYRLP